ncbi:mRNA interferase RelE [Vibrio sp. MACH09]|uniref:type II toxin-antitoxin system RelE family toxin n=1 Tax=Vibrio sp. MACH09 TaxID=3025122 RepID=UPI0027940681|nr:type II toxin-antitoxin system RelE/ParE family toxin [Vibrio sp. MACH09]GLO64205.1 mRNA interferase RelE [Vibrio sp. MACH09]
MTYKLKFDRKAKKAFDKLHEPVKSQFKAKLRELLSHPHIEGSALRGKLSGCYKIKLRTSGYRLIYKVEEGELIVLVLAIGKRERNDAYLKAEKSIERN